MSKLFYLLLRPAVFIKIGTGFMKVKEVREMMPEKYDKAKIEAWKKKYLNI